jgi:hypothetical protein
MESALDEIAAGERESKAYLKAFWQQVSPQFGETVVQAVVAARASTKTTRSTPSRAGTKTTRSTTSARTRTKPARSAARKPSADKAASAPAVVSELGVCPQCGKALVKRTGKRGAFVGCSGFPKCRFTKNLN